MEHITGIKIKKLLINDLYNKYSIKWEFNNSISVLVGDNGAGKSTILQILYCLLAPNALSNNPKIIPLFSSAELYLTNGFSIKISTKNKEMDPEIFSILSRIIKDAEFKNILNKKIKKKLRGNQVSNKYKAEAIETKINAIFNDFNDFNDKDISIVGKEVVLSVLDNNKNNVKINKLEELLNIELVSTLFMNANSANEIKGSDGNVFTILDLEIDKQIARLNLMSNKEFLKQTLIDKVNDFLKDKKALFIEENLFFNLNNNLGIITSSDLSSGERQLIYILLKAIILSEDKTKTPILIMDEPEISLHLSWQEKLLKCLSDINPTSQIIVATHSPAIVMDGWMASYKDIKDISN